MRDEALGRKEEQALIARVLGGDAEAYRPLVESHQALVYSMLMRYFGEPNIAEELCHECFIKAYRSLKSFRGDAAFGTWLVSIALNLARNYKVSSAYRRRLQEITFDTKLHDQVDDTENHLATEAKIVSVRLSIQALKPRYRDVMILCGLENRTYAETAKILGIPYGTVCSRMNKAISFLRKNLEKLEL